MDFVRRKLLLVTTGTYVGLRMVTEYTGRGLSLDELQWP